jgi:type I restriction enzyme M protein
VEGIVAMPSNLFYTVTIPVTLWFLNKKKAQKGKTLFIDARNMGTMVNRRLRELSDSDIAKIAGAFRAFDEGKLKAEKGFSASATIQEIAKQDYILTPGRYVGLAETDIDDEPFDEKMKRLTGELSGIYAERDRLKKEIKIRLGKLGWEI